MPRSRSRTRAEASVADAMANLRRDGHTRIVMSPYLLAPGHFAAKARTISVLHGATAVADVLGQHPLVAELAIRRYLTAMRASVGLGTARRARVA